MRIAVGTGAAAAAAACLLLFLTLLIPTTAYPTPSTATLGVLLPLTGGAARGGLRAKAILDLLLDDVNSGTVALGGLPANPLNGCTLHFAYGDTNARVVATLQRVHEFAAMPDLAGIIGGLYDNITLPAALLANNLNTFTIAPYARSATFSDRSQYPYFYRAGMSSEEHARVWLYMLPLYKWYRVAFISSDDDEPRGFMNLMLRGIAARSKIDPATNTTSSLYTVSSIVVPGQTSDLTTATIGDALDQLLREGEYRIFFLHAYAQSETILRMAHARGMVGLGPDGILRQWIGSFCDYDFAARFRDTPEILLGVVCFGDPQPRVQDNQPKPNLGARAFEARLRTAYPTIWTETSRLASQDMAVANAFILMLTFMRTAYLDPASGNTAEDFRRIGQQPITIRQMDGTPLVFQPNGEPKLVTDFINWSVPRREFVSCGTIDLTKSQINLTVARVYATGTSAYPKDRPRIYITGDELPQTYDGKIIVLTYVVAVLGAWTALILLEQTLSFWSRGGWKQAIGWTALAGVAFGGCSIFPTYVMNYTALKLDVDALLYYQGGNVVAAAVYPAAMAILAFLVALLSVDGGLKPAANVNANEVSDVSRSSTSDSQSSVTHHSRSQHLGAQVVRLFRSRVVRRVIKIKDFVVDLAKASTWRLPLAAMILAAATTSLHPILIDGFLIKAVATPHTMGYVNAMIFAFFLDLVALAMYFQVTRSSWRYIAPFVLTISTLAADFLLTGTITWTYVEGNLETGADAVRADATFAIIIASVCAAVCIALMIFNVDRLRVSRNVLDKVLSQVASQVRALEADIEYEKDATLALGEQASFFRRSLEVINLCRPIWRPYAVAMALADPSDAKSSAVAATTKEILAKPLVLGAPGDASNKPKLLKPRTALAVNRDASGNQKDSEAAASGRVSKSSGNKEAKGLLAPPESSVSSEKQQSGNAPAAIESSPASKYKVVVSSAHDPASASLHTAESLPGGVPQSSISPPPGAASGASAAGTSNTTSRPSLTNSNNAASAATNSDWQRIHAPKQSKQLVALLKEIADMNNLEGAMPSKVIGDIKLPQILSNPATLELMKDVLSKNLSPENIALWLDIQRFRSLENVQVRRAVADEILQSFIVNGAKFEVNLSSFMKDYVQTRINKNQITADLFEEVEREIYRLMVTNNVDALVTSPMFKLTALLLQHPLYKLDAMSRANNVRGEIGGNVESTIGTTSQASAATPMLTASPGQPSRGVSVGLMASGTPKLPAGVLASTTIGTPFNVVRGTPSPPSARTTIGTTAGGQRPSMSVMHLHVSPPLHPATPRVNGFMDSLAAPGTPLSPPTRPSGINLGVEMTPVGQKRGPA